MDGLVLTGEVRKVEVSRGNTNGKEWTRIVVHILGEVDVYPCNVGRDWMGPLPEKGDHGAYLVSARAYKRSGGDAVLALDLLGIVGGSSSSDESGDSAHEATRALSSVG